MKTHHQKEYNCHPMREMYQIYVKIFHDVTVFNDNLRLIETLDYKKS